MKTNFLENKIEIEPENIFEEAYLQQFMFETTYEYTEENNGLTALVIERKKNQ